MAFRLVPAEGVLSGKLTGAYTLTGTFMQSSDYVPGVSGWAIFGDGSAEFNNGTFRGVVTAAAFIGTDFEITPAGEFFYSASPGAGDLIASIASTVTADPFGNTVRPGGFSAYGSGGSTAFLGSALVGGTPETLLRLFTGASFEGTSFQLINAAQGSGAAAFLSGVIAGPETNVAGHADIVAIQFNSANQGGTSTANGQVFYSDPSHVEHVWATWDATGLAIVAARVTAADPGGGTPAIAETWHTISLDANWTAAGGQTPQYRLLPDGQVELKGTLTHTTGIATGGVNINAGNPLPAAYTPSAAVYVRAGDTNRAGLLQHTTGILGAFGNGTVTLVDLAGTYWPGS